MRVYSGTAAAAVAVAHVNCVLNAMQPSALALARGPNSIENNLAGYGCIDAKVRTNQVWWQFLALYLVRRTNLWVSCVRKMLFPYTKDTFYLGNLKPMRFPDGAF